MKFISKINNVEWDGYKFDNEVSEAQNLTQPKINSCSDIIKDKLALKNLVLITINWTTCSF